MYELAMGNGSPSLAKSILITRIQTVTHVPITFANGKTEMGFYEMISHDPVKLNIFLKGMVRIRTLWHTYLSCLPAPNMALEAAHHCTFEI